MPIERTPAPRARSTEHSAHSVRFYDDEGPLLEEVAAFLEPALHQGGAVILIANAPHLDILRRQLAGLDPAWSGAERGGRVTIVDAQAALDQFMVEGWPDAQRFEASIGATVRAACAGVPRVHAFGEMVAVLCEQGRYQAALRLEQMWNGLRASCRFSLFCAYPWSQFTAPDIAATFQHICSEHDHAAAAGTAAAAETHRGATLEQQNRALRAEVERLRRSEQTLLVRERELVDFVDNAAEGLHRVGRDGVIEWANQAELDMLGYQWHEYVGHHITEFHLDRDVIDTILVRLRAGDTLYDQPARLRCKDGSAKHVRLHSNACFVDGHLRYTRCFTRDATDRQRLIEADQARQRLLAELTAMNAAKDEFLAMLAHELRNPLAPISAAGELLARVPHDRARVAQSAAIVQRQARHLTALLDDLLDVARVTRGLIQLAREPVDLRQVLAVALEQVAPLVAQQRHQLSAGGADQPVWVDGDQKRLVQVAVNVLTNAAKYTPAGGVIRAELTADGGQAVLAVADNGTGMPPELAARVFDLFSQGQRPVHRTQGGLGVGLALARKVVESHGGTIHAHSDGPGRGSVFRIVLPLLAKGAPDTALPAAAAAPAPARRVLIVDDNVDAALALQMLLGAGGHEVILAHDGAQALRAAAAGFDLCLLDIGLPDMDGRELARRLRALPGLARARLVALSGYGQPSDRDASLAAGCEQHLVKPVSPEDLFALLADGR